MRATAGTGRAETAPRTGNEDRPDLEQRSKSADGDIQPQERPDISLNSHRPFKLDRCALVSRLNFTSHVAWGKSLHLLGPQLPQKRSLPHEVAVTLMIKMGGVGGRSTQHTALGPTDLRTGFHELPSDLQGGVPFPSPCQAPPRAQCTAFRICSKEAQSGAAPCPSHTG